jgi:zinc D-Ala-D-Ala carboxypeptidase
MISLSQHFSLAEAVASEYAARHDIDNTPPPDVLENMRFAAQDMESVRSLLLFPIHVNSWYRCFALNLGLGGVATSAHLTGWAIDFICPQFGNPYDVATELQTHGLKFDQLILEYGWVHASFAPTMRQMTLTKRNATAPYQPGLLKP